MLSQATPVFSPPKKVLATDEQIAIVEAVGSNKVVAGQAFAGTGKTSTGILTAATYAKKRTLVLCFNAANAAEGKRRYPKGTTVVTTHGLAYQYLENARKARLSQNWNVVTVKGELPLFGHKEEYVMASMVQGVLQDFFHSRDREIDTDQHGLAAFDRVHASDLSIRRAGDLANQYWAAMQTKDTVKGLRTSVNTVRIPHDAYLKEFSLAPFFWGYDIVIFDEAQDANPVTLGMLERQLDGGSSLLYLGDRHQAIYDFRGAINAMEHLPKGAVTLPLTQSWRFGPDTAYVANLLLGELKGEEKRIQGMGEDRDFDGSLPYTRLSRTNADLLDFAIAKSGVATEETATPIQWIGGIEKYRVGLLGDLYLLKQGRLSEISDPYVRRHFNSWSSYVDAGKYDHEAKLMSDLVETYNDMIPTIIERLIANQVDSGARYRVATGHKSKGLEWNQVALADDFRGPLDIAEAWLSNSTSAAFPEAEVNLLYVMATRARHALLENHELRDWRLTLKSHRSKRTRVYTQEDRDQPGQDERAAHKHPGMLRMGAIKPFSIRL